MFAQYRLIIIAAICALIFVSGFGTALPVQSWRYESKIAKLESARALDQVTGVQMALDNLTQATATIKAAASDYASVQVTLNGKIDGLRKELKNAKPLAPECAVLDPDRLRIAQDAVRAARDTATGLKSGGALRNP